MVKIYNESSPGRSKVFFVVRDGQVSKVITGNHAVPTEQGLQFYVDDYVAEQIHKFNLRLDGFEPVLELKNGEHLFVPEENDEYKKRKEIEELEERLKKLKAD